MSRGLGKFLGIDCDNIATIQSETLANMSHVHGIPLEDEATPPIFDEAPSLYWDFSEAFEDSVEGRVLLDIEGGPSGVTIDEDGFFDNAAIFLTGASGSRTKRATINATLKFVINFWRKDPLPYGLVPSSWIRVESPGSDIVIPTVDDLPDYDPDVWHMYTLIFENGAIHWYIDGQFAVSSIANNWPFVPGSLTMYMGTGEGRISELAVFLEPDNIATAQERLDFVAGLWYGGEGIVWRDGSWQEVQPA